METARPVFSLVIPVYRNLGSLPELLRQVGALAERLPGALELVMVVDASPDGSYGYLLEHLPRQAFDSQLLLLARNFGSFAAIRLSRPRPPIDGPRVYTSSPSRKGEVRGSATFLGEGSELRGAAVDPGETVDSRFGPVPSSRRRERLCSARPVRSRVACGECRCRRGRSSTCPCRRYSTDCAARSSAR